MFITFTVKGYDKNGKYIDVQHYDTHKLHELNGHWRVVARMAEFLKRNKKVKTLRYFVDNVEHAWSDEEMEWKAV